jgi:hypothetical protein
MPEVKQGYAGLEARTEVIKYWEALGYRMLHDNFDDLKWKHGDPIVGTMTFTDEPEPIVPIPEPSRDLAAEIDMLKADIDAIKAQLTIEGA